MVLKDFTELIQKVRSSNITKKIVVVSADDAHTLEAVMRRQETESWNRLLSVMRKPSERR